MSKHAPSPDGTVNLAPMSNADIAGLAICALYAIREQSTLGKALEEMGFSLPEVWSPDAYEMFIPDLEDDADLVALAWNCTKTLMVRLGTVT